MTYKYGVHTDIIHKIKLPIAYDKRNPLTEKEKTTILDLHQKGLSNREIAKRIKRSPFIVWLTVTPGKRKERNAKYSNLYDPQRKETKESYTERYYRKINLYKQKLLT